ncbi:hypothetical protein UFOVP168_48 [uncultured Caudovirales phage]|uniref:Uncharacterized protein n=1 Tax=uncultured Caudovirales phage TaxID=2100421 RepID=A0A6J7WG37_9CAUD|nr:hypothetical protein UFOVP168_48 [uncultured Caudovirales phage]
MTCTIRTTLLSATSTRPTRMKARIASGTSVTVAYDHAHNGDDNHALAFLALCRKMGKADSEVARYHCGWYGGDAFWVASNGR